MLHFLSLFSFTPICITRWRHYIVLKSQWGGGPLESSGLDLTLASTRVSSLDYCSQAKTHLSSACSPCIRSLHKTINIVSIKHPLSKCKLTVCEATVLLRHVYSVVRWKWPLVSCCLQQQVWLCNKVWSCILSYSRVCLWRGGWRFGAHSLNHDLSRRPDTIRQNESFEGGWEC